MEFYELNFYSIRTMNNYNIYTSTVQMIFANIAKSFLVN